MKFTEFPYERPDRNALLLELDRILEETKNASTADTQIEKAEEMTTLFTEYETMYSLAFIRNSQNSADPFYKDEILFYDETLPMLSEKSLAILKEILFSKFRPALEAHFGKNRFIALQNEFAMIEKVGRLPKEVMTLMTEEEGLSNQYLAQSASARILFDGKELTLAELTKYKQDKDASVRKAAFEAEGNYYLENKKIYDEIFLAIVKNRAAQAKALGFSSYTSLGYINRGRIGYGRAEIEAFRAGVATHLIPVIGEMKKRQAERIGKDTLSITDDTYLFSDGNPLPIGTPDELLEKAITMYREMSPVTKDFIDFMAEHDLFDLVSRHDKRLGGYCTFMPNFKAPFIFSNFNGTAGDIDVLTHEAGHALNSFVNRANNSFSYFSYSMEVAETHSMTMEFFAEPWYQSFFGADTDKYILSHYESALSFIPYGCMVDEFQHFVYDDPSHTIDEMNQFWLSLEKKYRPYLNMDSLPFYSDGRGWQRQLHIYTLPFYYIDYCLAQTNAFSLYMENQHDEASAKSKYMYFIENSKKEFFSDLLAHTEIPSPFKEETLASLATFSNDWLHAHALKK